MPFLCDCENSNKTEVLFVAVPILSPMITCENNIFEAVVNKSKIIFFIMGRFFC
ncbi:hypothetical protein D3C72_2199210 [compost metagenome]